MRNDLRGKAINRVIISWETPRGGGGRFQTISITDHLLQNEMGAAFLSAGAPKLKNSNDPLYQWGPSGARHDGSLDGESIGG